jgi:hypothetical protein
MIQARNAVKGNKATDATPDAPETQGDAQNAETVENTSAAPIVAESKPEPKHGKLWRWWHRLD